MRVASALLVGIGVLSSAPSALAASDPLTLEGETFVPDRLTLFEGTCSPGGTAGFVKYTIEGQALGPYPGTFVETGTIGFGDGRLSPDITFTIETDAGELIQGVKTLPWEDVGAVATCTSEFPGIYTWEIHGQLRYEASLPGFEDYGQAFLDLEVIQGLLLDFSEVFYLSEAIIATPGKVAGGGSAQKFKPDPPDDENFVEGEVTFAFAAQNTDRGMKGSGVVFDSSTDTTIKLRDVTFFAQQDRHATFRGTAEINGAAAEYTIHVFDVAEPGAGADLFEIWTTAGYFMEGVVTTGNIQTRRQGD